MNREEKELLENELKHLEQSGRMLKHSYDKCYALAMKEEYSFDELDSFEALTSRFARTSDVLIQKIFRLLDIIELESEGSTIDRINRAEGRGLIEDAEILKDIRRLRNDIAHEYKHSAVEQIFRNVLEFTPTILESISRVHKYCEKYLK